MTSLHLQQHKTLWKKRPDKHGTLAVVRQSQQFLPRRRPPSQRWGTAKINQLEMVTIFTYKPRIQTPVHRLAWNFAQPSGPSRHICTISCDLQTSQQQRWFTRSSLHESAIATASWRAYPGRQRTDKLQRVMNGAARVVTNMRKFDRGMTHARRHDLHWLTAFLTASNIDCASLFTSAYMEWHHSTCLITVRL